MFKTEFAAALLQLTQASINLLIGPQCVSFISMKYDLSEVLQDRVPEEEG